MVPAKERDEDEGDEVDEDADVGVGADEAAAVARAFPLPRPADDSAGALPPGLPDAEAGEVINADVADDVNDVAPDPLNGRPVTVPSLACFASIDDERSSCTRVGGVGRVEERGTSSSRRRLRGPDDVLASTAAEEVDDGNEEEEEVVVVMDEVDVGRAECDRVGLDAAGTDGDFCDDVFTADASDRVRFLGGESRRVLADATPALATVRRPTSFPSFPSLPLVVAFPSFGSTPPRSRSLLLTRSRSRSRSRDWSVDFARASAVSGGRSVRRVTAGATVVLGVEVSEGAKCRENFRVWFCDTAARFPSEEEEAEEEEEEEKEEEEEENAGRAPESDTFLRFASREVFGDDERGRIFRAL